MPVSNAPVPTLGFGATHEEYRGRGADAQVHVVLGIDVLPGVSYPALCGRTVFRAYTHQSATTCAACLQAHPRTQARATYEPCG